jgi:Zn-dependent alcohol dehydrogenase
VVTLYQAGELRLRELVTRTYHLYGINPDGSGLAALAAGEGARGIIRW